MEKVILTKKGRENLKQQIEEKKNELRKLGIYKGSAAENEGDAWHDNFAFEQTEIKERVLIYEINELERKLGNSEVIDETSQNENIATIGAKITVNLRFNEEEAEVMTFSLVGDFENDGYSKISINSPLGKCIAGKNVGFKGKYSVDTNNVSVELLKIE